MKFAKLLLASLIFCSTWAAGAEIQLKDLARVEQTRGQTLIGYGLVTGLAGTGDSLRNKMTVQSLRNTLSRFGVEVMESDISSRNVAAVIVSADLSAYSEVGGRFDVSVSSIGDAKSLSGGYLMLAPLKGIDDKVYGLAKGPLAVGGYQVEANSNSYQKNHPTSGQVVMGGVLERPLEGAIVRGTSVNIYLNEPDYTTAMRIVTTIRERVGVNAVADHAGKLVVDRPPHISPVEFIAGLEKLRVTPDIESRVVVNEKTGTIVSGGSVLIGAVSISHGNLKIEVDTDFAVSQPTNVITSGRGIASVVTPDTNITVNEDVIKPVSLGDGATVADLVITLNRTGLTTRDVITILRGIKSAGALHAELVIQ